jgi:hypothetical protein
MTIQQIVLKRLEAIIHNWNDKKELRKVLYDPDQGLCVNLFERSLTEKDGFHNFNYDMMSSWTYFYEQGDDYFPLGVAEYENSEFEEKYSNPKRLHLAVHMLHYIRFHGSALNDLC